MKQLYGHVFSEFRYTNEYYCHTKNEIVWPVLHEQQPPKKPTSVSSVLKIILNFAVHNLYKTCTLYTCRLSVTKSLPLGEQAIYPFGGQMTSSVHVVKWFIAPTRRNTGCHFACFTKVIMPMICAIIESSKSLGSQNPYLAILKTR